MRVPRSSSQQQLNVPTVTTDFGRRAFSFSYCPPKIWNEIPAATRNVPTVQTFKHRLKPTCLVLRTIIKHVPTSHLATIRALDSVGHILRHCTRYKSTYYYYYYYYILSFPRYKEVLVGNLCFSPFLPNPGLV